MPCITLSVLALTPSTRDMMLSILSDERARDEEWEGERGVINEELILRFIFQFKHDIASTGFYICGPVPMIRIVISALRSAGVKRARIHFEKFVL